MALVPTDLGETNASGGPLRQWGSRLYGRLTDPPAGTDALEQNQQRLLATTLLGLLFVSMIVLLAQIWLSQSSPTHFIGVVTMVLAFVLYSLA